MTIFKVDDETFSIIVLALNECGYDLDGLEIEIYDEINEIEKECETCNKILKKNKKKKSRVD